MTMQAGDRRPPLAVLALCLCLAGTAAQSMEVERTDLEPWQPVYADTDTTATPWQRTEADDVCEIPPDDPVADDAGAGAEGEVGYASFYGHRFHGRRTASGHPYDASGATAAHRRLPLGTLVSITNLVNGRTALATITDRGPFVRGRIIDVSRAIAARLGFIQSGRTKVRIAVRGFNPLPPPPQRTSRTPR